MVPVLPGYRQETAFLPNLGVDLRACL
ncbi:hypothetical protein TRIP_B200751 [uncultured Desulfatiglans sp.]|nr:hypothetical protein TRIP_B200751 [uncultured Desulfatiglans sp.]